MATTSTTAASNITTTTEATTTPFWESENNFDIAEVMTKRVTFTVYTWLFRVMIMLGLMMVITFVICVPIAITLMILNSHISRVIVRKRKYWQNEDLLIKEVQRKVDEKAEQMKQKQEEKDFQVMQEAIQDVQKLKALQDRVVGVFQGAGGPAAFGRGRGRGRGRMPRYAPRRRMRGRFFRR